MISDFHFLHPGWFLSFLPLAVILWFLYQRKAGKSAWSNVIDANLLPLLLKGSESKTSRLGIILLAIAWFITVLALADPVWEKIPRPVFQTNAARVIVLDLSRSMLIPDLKPSRLARARFKVEDILSRNEEGQTGLVVFAGDGFTAAPLTRDTDTIRSLLQVLKPDIMPVQGSRADLGLLKAHELLKQAGIANGQVLLIADGVVGDLAEKAASKLLRDGYTVSVMAVGTEAGGVIPGLNQAVTVKLDISSLQAVARQGGGRYHLISNNNADLQQLLNPLSATSTQADEVTNQDSENSSNSDLDSDLQSQDWKSNAPYLILLLLPLAALAFRRGWLLNIVLLIGISSLSLQPQNAMAFSFNESLSNSLSKTWDNLWQRQDQQADKALQQQKYEQASQLAKDPLRLGSAEYKQGNYQQALEDFTQATGADANYNRGNTLAKLQKFEDAIKAYDEALKQNASHEDAKVNKKAIEKMLEEQKKQQGQKQNPENQDQDQDKDQNKDNENQSGDSNDKKEQNSNSDQAKKDDKSEQQQNNKADNTESAEKGTKQEQADNNKQDKQQQDQQGEKNNQFSDAAKKLEEDKKDGDQQNKKAQQSDKSDDEQNEAKDKATQQEQQQAAENGLQHEPDHDNQEAINGTNAKAEELTKEEKIAAEQWLRRIPDDPGGLLRRKFTRQYRQRNPQVRGPANNTNFW